jgi:type II secretory pathway pseudopilin PulG
VVIAIIGTLVGLLLPAVQSAREAARRSGCSFNIRGLAQALMVYESTKRRFPSATDRNENTGKAGNATNGDLGSGYSWIFHILPYMEEGALYNNVSSNTTKFRAGPFSTATSTNDTGTGGAWSGQQFSGQHASTVVISQLVCPSYTGGTAVLTEATEAPNDESFSSEYGSLEGTVNGEIAITNYKAMSGTHISTVAVGTKVANMPLDNGVLVFAPDQPVPSSFTETDDHLPSRAGIKQSGVSDGMSKTAMVVESKERGHASWIDGITSWVVAYDPNETTATEPALNNGVWVESGTTPISTTGLNFPASKTPSNKYLPQAKFRAQGIGGTASGMAYGPSSDHQGGITMHVFGDTHVAQVTEDVDPVVYLSICTRNSGESANLEQ